MDGLQARLQSFKKSKRVKNPNKSSTTTLKWPHPQDFIANPAALAEAGFYYDPSYDDPDNVTCFNCEKQLAGWEEDDDPYFIHWNKCAQTCCWAVVQCGLRADMDSSGRFVFSDKTRLPNHKTMEKARLETFTLGKGWVHDKKKNHGANSKSMARAGFAYTPHETGDDLASCLYCDVSLSGWDDDDDPIEEHRKRATKSDTNCPFFEQTESRQTRPPPTKHPSKSSSKPPSRTTSRTKYQDVLVPTKTFDSEVEDESDIPKPKSTTHGLGAKTPAKPRQKSRASSAKTPGAKSRSVSRSGFKNIAEEVEDDEEVTEPPRTVKKKTRSAPKPVAKAEAPTESDVEQATEPPPTVKKKTRSGSKSVAKSEAPAPSDVDDEVEKAAEAPHTIKKKSRASSKSVARSEARFQSDGEGDVTTTARRPTRSRAKSKAPIEVEKDEEEEPIRKPSRSKSKVAADTKGDDAALPRKTSRKASKPKVVPEDSDKAEPVPRSAVGGKTNLHNRSGSRSRPKSPEAGSNVEEAVTATTTIKTTANTKPNPRSQSRLEILDVDDLFNDDIVPVEECVPPPSSLPPSTTNQLPPLFIPKRTKDKPKPVNKVVEISSDEEEIEKKAAPISYEPKTPKPEPGLSNLSTVNGVKDSQHHGLEKRQPIEDTMDISMHDPGTQETVTDTEQELHTAPSTPPKPTLHEEASRSDAPHVIPQTPNDKPTEPQPSAPSTNITPPLTTEPAYLPPLSRLPFMPLQTLNEAELDMTVEEWIRYQIEVEQDRFKRDGEKELERFTKRAEEVRKAIEGL